MRLSRWKVQEQLGKMPAHGLQAWIDYGLIPPPEDDGQWDAAVLTRIEAALALKDTVRALPRRAFRMHAMGFAIPVDARRRVAMAVLQRVRPASGKMTQVRREYAAFASAAQGRFALRKRSYRHELPFEVWFQAIEDADEETFRKGFERAGRYAEILPGLAKSRGVRLREDLSYEERFVLLLVEVLLEEPSVRDTLTLPPLPAKWTPPLQ